MSTNGHFFVEWKEEFVSQEKGNRVVHYFLKDSAGESILAVVGTERSLRHMFYVVAEEFLQVCAAENTIHAGFKWRSRREVVDWLTSMLSKPHLSGGRSKSPRTDSIQVSKAPKFPEAGFSAWRTDMPGYQGRLARNVEGNSSDITWSGACWTCGKRLKHYPSFCRNGTTIATQSFVFIMAKEDDHYLAYLEDMYEDRKGQKKVKVRWFHQNQEVKGVVPLRNIHPKEVFITPYVQVISAECVDGPAIVLCPEHFEKCLASFPPALLGRVHLCFRQFRSNRVKPFNMSKLRGYFDQAIFSCLDPNPSNSICHSLAEEEDEDYSPRKNVKKGAKRARGCKGRQRFSTDHVGARICGNWSQIMDYEPPYKKLRYGLSARGLPLLKNAEPHSWNMPLFMIDEKVEVLCQDSGIRGCWFRCTVLQVLQKQIKIQYDDLQDDDGCGNLEEWIPAIRLAIPDKLGMRCLGRPTMRPAPSGNQEDLALRVGAPVDAWWSDGWWEGVIAGVDNSGDTCVHVYFPGENIYLNVDKRNLRISRDWVGDQWVDIEAKPDIMSAISAAITPDAKNSTSSTFAMDVKSNGYAISCQEVPTSTKLDIVEENVQTASFACSQGLPKEMACSNDKKQPSSNDENRSDHINDDLDRNNFDDDHGGDDDDGDNNSGKEEEEEEEEDDDDDHNDEEDDDIDISDDDNDGKLCMELETGVQKCEAVELMEVAA